MQLDELKKRIDNLTIGLSRKEALEIFTFLTDPSFNSAFIKSKTKKVPWEEFQKVKSLLDEDSKNGEGEGIKHASSRLFDCTVKLDLKSSSEKTESQLKYPKRWLDFEEAALIADNLFDKQKTEIDQLKFQQKREKASLLSFIWSVFDKHLLPFQKDQFKSFFPNYISLFNLIELIFPGKIQDKEIEKIFLKGEYDEKKLPWYVRELHKLANSEDKLKFSTIIPQFGSWFDIEATLSINDEQQVEIDEFLKNNFENNYDFNNFIDALINQSKTLTATQKETITVAHTQILGKTDRSSKRKRKPSQKVTEQNLSKAETSEEESFEKKSKKNQLQAKATKALSDGDRERIIAQIRIALDEMWMKNEGKKLGSNHSPKFQKLDKKGYLIFKILIKPDAQCKTHKEKIVFGKKVELLLKNEFRLQQNTQTSNFKLIEYDFQSKKVIFDSKWNKYCIKDKTIGLTLEEKEWVKNVGAVIVRGSTTAIINEKLAKLKKSAKKTSIVETSEIPERKSSAPPSSPQDLLKEISKSREHSEDEQIEDAPQSPELAPKDEQTAPSVVDLERIEISSSDEESQEILKELKKITTENFEKEKNLAESKKLLSEKTEELKKTEKRFKRKKALFELLGDETRKRTKFLEEEKETKEKLQEVATKLTDYRRDLTRH